MRRILASGRRSRCSEANRQRRRQGDLRHGGREREIGPPRKTATSNTSRSGPGWRCHGDHRTPPGAVRPAGREGPVYIDTQRWALEPWEGEDPPGLAKTWSRKPRFAVNGSRSCAELAIVHHLRNEGWHGVWVNSFGRRELRSEWFPAPAASTLAETGARPGRCRSSRLRTAKPSAARHSPRAGRTLPPFRTPSTWRCCASDGAQISHSERLPTQPSIACANSEGTQPG